MTGIIFPGQDRATARAAVELLKHFANANNGLPAYTSGGRMHQHRLELRSTGLNVVWFEDGIPPGVPPFAFTIEVAEPETATSEAQAIASSLGCETDVVAGKGPLTGGFFLQLGQLPWSFFFQGGVEKMSAAS